MSWRDIVSGVIMPRGDNGEGIMSGGGGGGGGGNVRGGLCSITQFVTCGHILGPETLNSCSFGR